LAEGGERLETTDLILNITCPGYSTLNHPDITLHGTSFDSDVIRYVGALTTDAQYTFPSFYPSFEYCNFITGYQIASEKHTSTTTFFGGIYETLGPVDMFLTSTLSTSRLPYL
jgi:hypothetical protein